MASLKTSPPELLEKSEPPPLLNKKMSKKAMKKWLETSLKGIQITSIETSPMKGIYQVFYGSEVLYVSENGQFLMAGNLIEIKNGEPFNHTQQILEKKAIEAAPKRASAIAAIPENEMVVFKAHNEKHAITVFTDVDCAYCRKLHKEVPQLNKNGVTVRYLAFPRAGLGSSSHKKLVSVWCANDRNKAMDDAKLKRKFVHKSCKNPLDSHYKLTRVFGLTGTPALILPSGELISGYMPYKKLIEHLNRSSIKKTKKKLAPQKK
jgi:thiol:disulfide interchange protein DsbC